MDSTSNHRLAVRFPGDPRIVLASNSPRRREILKMVLPEFQILPSDVDEVALPHEDPKNMAQRLALEKCKRVYETENQAVIVGADTVVSLEDHMFGKPKSREEAGEMLRALCGNTHQVHTGVAVYMSKEYMLFCETTNVSFVEKNKQLIEWYIDTGEPMDKAGAYGIQGKGALLVKSIQGDYLNVVGFPLSTFIRKLWEKGYVSFHK